MTDTSLYDLAVVAEHLGLADRSMFTDEDLVFLLTTIHIQRDGNVQITGGCYTPHAVDLILKYIGMRYGVADERIRQTSLAAEAAMDAKVSKDFVDLVDLVDLDE